MNREMKDVERWNDPAANFATVSCVAAILADSSLRPKRARRKVPKSQCTRARGPRTVLASPRDTAGTASVSGGCAAGRLTGPHRLSGGRVAVCLSDKKIASRLTTCHTQTVPTDSKRSGCKPRTRTRARRSRRASGAWRTCRSTHINQQQRGRGGAGRGRVSTATPGQHTQSHATFTGGTLPPFSLFAWLRVLCLEATCRNGTARCSSYWCKTRNTQSPQTKTHDANVRVDVSDSHTGTGHASNQCSGVSD